MVKSHNQYRDLMRLYLKHDDWSVRFMQKISNKLQLTPSQVYKWRWDRNENENKRIQMINDGL